MSEIIENPWTRLRSFTGARLALGRAGDSLPTREVLEFGLAHAQARDAVHHALNTEALTLDIAAQCLESITVQSAAQDRAEYLRRPDLGRKLNAESHSRLTSLSKCDLVFIVADGLSAIAPEHHAIPMLQQMKHTLESWQIAPVIIATQARVALGDEIGELLKAEMTVMLIGERPGLSSPDSLGIYLTYDPRVGRTDADRNCISNVRPEGLSYEAAAHKLYHLMLAAHKIGHSGVALKDESDQLRLS
ncbi:ethanolamine ammonia-lyase subunit EutC [Acidobacterium sp. S8]|uniref:ethanolamine ammonia-lyase subunit EutC n=1 Tax=Acidobacterium sp. S8 TaxID=1641854 RepID=UPI00131B635E|nr:ethanolamine ammonia-lyase subunit EutC [Acidobacterium sp. S8]